MDRTEEEIEEQINLSYEKNFSGMTYAEGVRAALQWILVDTYGGEAPMED